MFRACVSEVFERAGFLILPSADVDAVLLIDESRVADFLLIRPSCASVKILSALGELLVAMNVECGDEKKRSRKAHCCNERGSQKRLSYKRVSRAAESDDP